MPTESTFLLFALFMVAAAAGWAYARFVDRQVRGRSEEEPPLSQGYLRGLNLLLDDETDKALEMFVRMIATDDEALDTHFALGSLFRRRGELDRAIRIHQNILARPDLSTAQRHSALFALGEDYLRAGLMDRAESLFRQVAEQSEDPEPALGRLVGILENLGEWEQAITVRRELEMVSGERQDVPVAHYCCELAERALANGEARAARGWLKKAQRARRALPRGAIIRARLAEQQGDGALASRLLSEVVRTSPALLPEILPALHRLAARRGDLAALDALLRPLLSTADAQGVAYAAITCELLDPPVLEEALVALLIGDDTLASLVDAPALAEASGEARRQLLERMASGLRRLAQRGSRYRCGACGHHGQRMSWQCPDCRSWDTIRTTATLPLESVLAPPSRR